MERDAYFAQLDAQLREIFTIRRHGAKVPERERHRCEGFMPAARLLGIADDVQLQNRMERIHLEVFGLTIAERQHQESGELDPLDIPTVIRKGRAPDLPEEGE